MLEHAIERGRGGVYLRLTLSSTHGSLNGVRVVVVMDAGRTSPLVKVQSLSSCVPLVKCLLPNARGQAPGWIGLILV